jgi:hypothetical protein
MEVLIFNNCSVITNEVLFIYNVHIGQQMMNEIMYRMQ